MDFVSTVPIDKIIGLFMDSSNPLFQSFSLVKMNRIGRLGKIIRMLDVTGDAKAGLKIFKMVFLLVIYLHIYACMWWMACKNSKNWVPIKEIGRVDNGVERDMHGIYYKNHYS